MTAVISPEEKRLARSKACKSSLVVHAGTSTGDISCFGPAVLTNLRGVQACQGRSS